MKAGPAAVQGLHWQRNNVLAAQLLRPVQWNRFVRRPADLPVAGYKVLERIGTLQKRDTEKELYEFKDDEKNWKLVVPFADVEII